MQVDGIPADDIPDELVGLIIPWLDRWVLLSGRENRRFVRYIDRSYRKGVDTRYRLIDGIYQRSTGTQDMYRNESEFVDNDGSVVSYSVHTNRFERIEFFFPEHADILRQVRSARRKVVDPVDRCLVHGITVTELPLPEIELAGRTFRFEKSGFVHDYCIQPHEMFMSNINPQQRMNEWIDDFLVSFEWYWSQKSSGIDYKNYVPLNPTAINGLGATITSHAQQRLRESFESITIDGKAPEFAAPDHQ